MGGSVDGGAGLALVGEGWSAGAGEVLLEEMLEGWRRQQQARRLGPSIVGNRERVVRRFVEFTQGWPWGWREEDLERWVAQNRWAHSTVRSYQDAIGSFLDYVCDGRYEVGGGV